MYSMSVEEKSKRIKERNEHILKDHISVLDGGPYTFGYIYVIGNEHKKASEKMAEYIKRANSIESLIKYESKIEEMFGVQVWDSIEINIERILQHLQSN